MRRAAELVATSQADDLALRALADAVDITAGEEVRIVGGQMASLLLTAYPVPRVAPRRTRDADAAITTALAGSGLLHDRFLAAGYRPASSNRYMRQMPELAIPGLPVPELVVDLLVPSLDGRFKTSRHGGRDFDAAPGLAPALEAEPIHIDVAASLLDDTVLRFSTAVPTVEMALVIKALAYGSRGQTRDAEDIYRLLEIVDAYSAVEIGGWRLASPAKGSRGDAQRVLQELRTRARRLQAADLSAGRLAALIAAHVY